MNIDQVMDELRAIGDVYPTVRGLMNKQNKSGIRVGQVWAENLSDLDRQHFEDVCFEYSSLQKELPEPCDQLPFEIRREVRDRMAKEKERLDQHMKYHDKPAKVMDWVKNDRTGSISVHLGELVKAGRLTKEENDKRMDELMAWDKGGPKPEWMDEQTSES